MAINSQLPPALLLVRPFETTVSHLSSREPLANIHQFPIAITPSISHCNGTSVIMKVLIALLFAASQLFASALCVYDGFYVYGVRIPLVLFTLTGWTLLTGVGITGQKPDSCQAFLHSVWLVPDRPQLRHDQQLPRLLCHGRHQQEQGLRLRWRRLPAHAWEGSAAY